MADDLKKKRKVEVEKAMKLMDPGRPKESPRMIGRHLVRRKVNSELFNVNRDIDYKIPGKASMIAEHLVTFLTWESYDTADVDLLVDRFVEYVNYCHVNDMKISNEMCYLALGISRGSMTRWANGLQGTVEHQAFARKVLQFLSASREVQMMEGALNPVVGIWWQKNYDGLKDQQEIVLATRDPLENIKTVDSLHEKYLESVGIIEDPKLPPSLKPPQEVTGDDSRPSEDE